jgi:tetratricopeptide (TPR) repeat protein
MYLSEYPEMVAVATELLDGPGTATAHRLIGFAADRSGYHAAAMVRASTALALASTAGDDLEVARDAYTFAGALTSAGAYHASLQLIEIQRDAAIRLGDRKSQGYSELGRADTLRELGDMLASERALDVAVGLLAPYCDRVWALLKQGQHQFTVGHYTMARQSYARVLGDAPECQRPEVVVAAHVRLAWLDWLDGALPAAEAHLAQIERPGTAVALVRALIDVTREDLDRAARRLAEAESPAPTAELAWIVALVRAQVEERRGDLAAAEAAYGRAIAAVTALREASPSQDAYVVAGNRLPYEGLLGLLARSGRWREVFALVLALDAGDMLQVTAAPGTLGPDGVVRPAGSRTERLLNTRVATAERTQDVDVALDAWRGRDLVVVVAPSPRWISGVPDRVWRLHIVDGHVTGEDVGPAARADELAARLLGEPLDREAARALGDIVVPASASRAPLEILPVGRIARAPLSALRDSAGLILERRPLLRVLGLRPRPAAPAAAAPRTPAVVLGDSRLDLRGAAEEASWVAQRLGVPARLGRDATIAALSSAADATLLHLAAHTNEQANQRVVHLADGDVSPSAILAGRIAPSLVVLASCASAAAHDEGGWGSLAAAFLAAGSDAVVATHWSVEDAAAAELVRRFYLAGGATDPVRALAEAQTAAAASSAGTSWAAFTLIAAPPLVRR